MKVSKTQSPGMWKRLSMLVNGLWKKDIKEINVYFISGMCYNCKVFDKLTLPPGYKKVYIEWYIPRPDESLSEYAHTMAKDIDTSSPFILIGYSFGAVVMQEMTMFLQPEKCIIISSFKSKREIPILFQAVRKVNLMEYMPKRFFSSTDFITTAFNRFVYNASNSDLAEYMTVTDPVYIRWALENITDWMPDYKTEHLYHIHGTADQIFPYDRIEDVFPVDEGDHLMVVKKADIVSSILDIILLKKEE